MQGNGGFTGRFRSVDLNDPAPRNTADAQGIVQGQAAGGNHGDIAVDRIGSHFHHGTLTALLVQIGQRVLQCFELFFLNAAAFGDGSLISFCGFFRCHVQILQFKIHNSKCTFISAAGITPAGSQMYRIIGFHKRQGEQTDLSKFQFGTTNPLLQESTIVEPSGDNRVGTTITQLILFQMPGGYPRRPWS